MKTHSYSPKSGGTFQNILAAVVIALLVGTSSPWWWAKLFPSKSQGGGRPDSQPSLTQSSMGELEGGTNRQGGDLSGVGIQVNSAQECSDYCAAEGNCRAMTFVKHPDANGGICWLKGSVPSPHPNPLAVSAVKRFSRR